jgi:hypothetical protein
MEKNKLQDEITKLKARKELAERDVDNYSNRFIMELVLFDDEKKRMQTAEELSFEFLEYKKNPMYKKCYKINEKTFDFIGLIATITNLFSNKEKRVAKLKGHFKNKEDLIRMQNFKFVEKIGKVRKYSFTEFVYKAEQQMGGFEFQQFTGGLSEGEKESLGFEEVLPNMVNQAHKLIAYKKELIEVIKSKKSDDNLIDYGDDDKKNT